ncbi:MAG: N-6 DNA methylase [Nitrospirota bacterium]|nr:N-6 DNA methylase [Nitrospirota bacterium]
MIYALMRNDDEYLKIVGKYRNDRPHGEREIDHFCNAFGLLMKHMAETNEEALGQVYEQWEIANKHNGQFFTPVHVCNFIAQMIAGNDEAPSISDPACGSGRLLIAKLKTMTNAQADKAVFVGQDVDFTCVMMCALNFVFFNVNGYVIWGNALARTDYRRVFRTVRSYMGGSIIEIDPETIKPATEAPEVKTPDAGVRWPNEQTSFFK